MSRIPLIRNQDLQGFSLPLYKAQFYHHKQAITPLEIALTQKQFSA
jgi:hypothetical protein